MNELQTEQFTQSLNEVAMTPQERRTRRHMLHALTLTRTQSSPASFWAVVRSHLVVTALSGVLIFIGALGYSAHDAKPSDMLYGFRLAVNDPLQVALTRDEGARLQVRLDQINRQLSEETL